MHNGEGALNFTGVISSSEALWMKSEGLESSEPQAHPKAYVYLKETRKWGLVAGTYRLLCKWHPASPLQANSDPHTKGSNCAHWTPIRKEI